MKLDVDHGERDGLAEDGPGLEVAGVRALPDDAPGDRGAARSASWPRPTSIA